MKRTYTYSVNGKQVEREYGYIPVRYILAIMMTALSVLAVIAIVAVLCYLIPYFYLAAYATWIYVIIRIAASDDNPDYKAPWLLVVMLVPIGGFMLYFMFYSRTLEKKFVKRLRALEGIGYGRDCTELLAELKESDPVAYGQIKMLCELSGSCAFTDTAQEYFPSGEAMLERLLPDLESARNFIYMEYFIIEEGKFWNSILEVLKRKAASGVEVKLIFDDIGCMSTLPGDYSKQLSAFGIEATPFSRLRGNADSEFNNRSHRKITVIDGRVGYTGGINLADEYINEIVRFGHWKDTGIRIEGEAVRELTRLFLFDFGINVKELPTLRADLYPECERTGAEGIVVPFGDGPRPIYERRVGKSVIENMLVSATDHVYMTTPYLIPDSELCSAIENAALRGVDVKIIVPHIPDKRLVLEMTRSFYGRLMAAGVEIYEYERGFIHAKSYVADGKYAMIGTINLDYRSLVHNFENGVFLYGAESIGAISEDIQATLDESIRITEDMLKVGFFTRALRAVLRIFSPMM